MSDGTTTAEHPVTEDSGPPPKWKIIGPGLLVAATGVGAADLVATLIAGQKYGYALIWVAVLGCILKIILVEGAGRYTLSTQRSIFEGWRSLGVWTTIYFVPYIIIWGFVYGAAAMSSSAPTTASWRGALSGSPATRRRWKRCAGRSSTTSSWPWPNG